MSKPVMSRWWVVLGAILIQLCLGVIYAWSVFTKALTEEPFGFLKTQTQVIFSVGLATFAVVTVISGRLQGKIPPRIMALAGGLVLGAGYIAAYFMGASYGGLVLTIGLVGGAGIGLAYTVPIAVGVRWFPDKKGLLTGLAVAGFGFGALLWIYLAGSFGGWIAKFGVSGTFLMFGVLFILLVGTGAIWMVNPPEGYVPSGWNPEAAKAGRHAAAKGHDFSSFQMLRTPQFYQLWVMFAAGAMAGLMVIGCIKLFGTERLLEHFHATGMDDADAVAKAAATTELAMAVFFAIANGLGRIVWGIISDVIGRKASLGIMLFLQAAVMASFYWLAASPTVFCVAAALIGFNFGGNFALFPAATADLFGNRNVGANYGWVFTSYGLGGIVGPILGGWFGDFAKNSGSLTAWLVPFLVAAGACLLAAFLAAMLKSPKAASQAVETAAAVLPERRESVSVK
ncbi:L-lactate MFS transporter [Thermopirellula anaerolimosa]